MEVIQLKPAIKDYLWGGRKLAEKYHKESDLDKVSETWELSTHHDGSSIIINGKHKGELFKDYIASHDKSLWGTHCEKYENFPILIKFIDAKQALSIQVHPDDEYALRVEKEYGKNEFWYILEAEEDAFLYYGVKHDMTKEEFRSYIENDTVCDHLGKVNVKPGDCFFIKAGTIHAIGAGIVLAEIQQSSNSTYRVYDFKRLGADGKPRELHIDKAIDVSILTPSGKNGEPDGSLENHEGYDTLLLTDNDYFKVTSYDIHTSMNQDVTMESFQALTVVDGEGTLITDTESYPMIKGDSFFIPAQNANYTIKGEIKVLKTVL